MTKEQAIAFLKAHWVKILVGLIVIVIAVKLLRRAAGPKLTDPALTGTVHEQIDQEQLTNSGQLSRPISWYGAQSDALYNALWPWGGLWEYDDDAEEILKQCQTLEDVLMLISVYGVRGPGFLISDAKNLPATIRARLDDSNKQAVNEDYASKGIDWLWL